MKIKKTLLWIVTLMLLLSPAIAAANGKPRLRLAANSLRLTTGQEITVDLLIESAPLIYGVESHLAFDPAALEVVDADPGTSGVQLTPGDFIDFDHAFVLQNQADNQAGVLDYALTLLHPALPVQGSGLLARITFRAKVDGPATIRIVSGLFGTQTGETIAPVVQDGEITITALADDNSSLIDETVEQAPSLAGPSEEPSVEPSTASDEISNDTAVLKETEEVQKSDDKARLSPGLIILGIGLVLGLAVLAGVGLVGGWLWLAPTLRK